MVTLSDVTDETTAIAVELTPQGLVEVSLMIRGEPLDGVLVDRHEARRFLEQSLAVLNEL